MSASAGEKNVNGTGKDPIDHMTRSSVESAVPFVSLRQNAEEFASCPATWCKSRKSR